MDEGVCSAKVAGTMDMCKCGTLNHRGTDDIPISSLSQRKSSGKSLALKTMQWNALHCTIQLDLSSSTDINEYPKNQSNRLELVSRESRYSVIPQV